MSTADQIAADQGLERPAPARNTETGQVQEYHVKRHALPVRLLAEFVPHVIFVTVIILAWDYAARHWLDPLVLSSPVAVAQSLINWFTTGYIYPHIGFTVFALFSGFIIGGVVAFTLAVVLTELPRLGRFVEPYIITLDAIPNIALVPIFIVWFGFGIENKILMAFLTAFFVIFIASYQGVRNTDARYLELARVLNATKAQTLFKIRLWYSIPFLASAAKVALPKTALAVVVAEYLGSNQGLGYVIVRSSNLLNIPNLLAGVVILTVLVQVLSLIATAAERHALSWVPKEKK
jgi:NitT/TauT family transport system permease protein